MTTEPNWDTGEVDLHLANTEDLYLRAKRCQSAAEMRSKFAMRIPGCRVNWRNVDWGYIYDQFEEDRTNADS